MHRGEKKGNISKKNINLQPSRRRPMMGREEEGGGVWVSERRAEGSTLNEKHKMDLNVNLLFRNVAGGVNLSKASPPPPKKSVATKVFSKFQTSVDAKSDFLLFFPFLSLISKHFFYTLFCGIFKFFSLVKEATKTFLWM